MFENNAKEAKIYVKWVFAKKIKTTNYSVYSFGFFVNPSFVNDYKLDKARAQVLKRSSSLPQDFLDWCSNNYPEIFQYQELKTWNDLNGLITHIKSYGSNNVEGYVVKEAVRLGLLENELTYKRLEV